MWVSLVLWENISVKYCDIGSGLGYTYFPIQYNGNM